MAQLYANNASSTLAAGISAGANAVTVFAGDGSKFPNPTGGDFFLVTLFQKIGATEVNWEIVKCTGRVGDVLTIVRNIEGSTAKAFNAGDALELRLTAGTMGTDSIAEGVSNKYFTVSRVVASVLAGLDLTTNAAITVADTVLSALGKLQKQVTDLGATKLNALSGVLTGESYTDVDKGNITTPGSTVTFSYADGDSQRLQVGVALTINVSNWPSAGKRGFLLLEIINGGAFVVTVAPSINWIKPDGSKTSSLTAYLASLGRTSLQASGTDLIVLTTRDGGVTLYGKVL